MHRMLQGEVGSGKTIVSVLAMLQMVDAGYQCALLAPTEVLAAQHARSIRDVLGPLAMAGQLGGEDGATRVALLTGSMTPQQKREVRDEVAGGDAGIVIGTHALLQDAVEFQPRHGRRRRTAPLWRRAAGSVARQGDRWHHAAPAGDDRHADSPHRGAHGLRRPGDVHPARVAKGTSTHRQQHHLRHRSRSGSTGPGSASARRSRPGARPTWSRHASTKPTRAAIRALPPVTVVELRASPGTAGGLRLGLMHGRLPSDEKDAVMSAFRAGDVDVLVCTTVIEVGVDVPNATVMVVMDADRFGISQLHQLGGDRSRQHASLCLLATDLPRPKAGERSSCRRPQDGFELADLDLRERRQGDVLGYNSPAAHHVEPAVAGRTPRDHRGGAGFAESVYDADPNLTRNPGIAVLAAPFSDTDRVESWTRRDALDVAGRWRRASRSSWPTRRWRRRLSGRQRSSRELISRRLRQVSTFYLE